MPTLWYQVIFQPGAVDTLSLIPPYNECTVNFSCNQHIKEFRAWAVKGQEYTGEEKGKLISEFTNRDAEVQLSFNINCAQHLTEGDGVYTIVLFVKNDEGLTNSEMFLVTTEQDSSSLYLYVKDGESSTNYIPLMAIDDKGEPEPLTA